MSEMTPYNDYIQTLQKKLAQGDATEHTHRPGLAVLVENLSSGISATNEPKRIACGAPDFVIRKGEVTIGYIEAKDIGTSLDSVEKSEQLQRYLKSLSNLILTDYLEFRWYVDGEKRLTARLGTTAADGKIKKAKEGIPAVAELFTSFLEHKAEKAGTPQELARRMARLAHMIRDLIIEAFKQEEETGSLHNQLAAFRDNLIPDLSTEDFADMYAQTIAYGLFAARCAAPDNAQFTRQNAAYLLPKTNPFLRKLFNTIAGPELDDRIAWLVDDLAQVLAQADMEAVLKNFGKHSGREDPVVHFYETFLTAYDPKVREMRGVYYTPEPVVSYIVRSIDHILKTRFGKPQGLADENTLILDPATGTATFLYMVIQEIHRSFAGQEGLWNNYVAEKLLKRIFGFELLMAPYAVAHLKLGLLLQETGYEFLSDQRLGVYLTNTLDEAVKHSDALFAQWISEEANAAAEIKKEKPIMVVLGNPPYSGISANDSTQTVIDQKSGKTKKGLTWIGKLIDDYKIVDGQPLSERKHWLQNDYVKFLRFGQWRVERTQQGILGFITDNSYLDGPTFRGMRQSLINCFNDIFILNLHGNSNKKEVTPEGTKDENVFDIQQGVSICLLIKELNNFSPAKVHYVDLWGIREGKYQTLLETDINDTPWEILTPNSPFYFFIRRDEVLKPEYENGWKVNEIFPLQRSGIITARDEFVVDFEPGPIKKRLDLFLNKSLSDEEVQEKLSLSENYMWRVSTARKQLMSVNDWESYFNKFLYRPFDIRSIYFHKSVVWRTREEITRHIIAGENLVLTLSGQTKDAFGAFATKYLVGHKAVARYDVNYAFPLYLYPAEGEMPLDGAGRRPNLNPEFIEEFSRRLGMKYEPHPLTSSEQKSAPSAPSPFTERGTGGEVEDVTEHDSGAETEGSPAGEVQENTAGWSTPSVLWERLKPLARQMRKEPTEAEALLWQYLRNRQLLDCRFRRQHSIERFIVDFYCAEAGLVVEADGPVHQYSREEDLVRQDYLESQGLHVLCFSNEEIIDKTDEVIGSITETLQMRLSSRKEEQNDDVFTPDDTFNYAYAVFHSPTYRTRYAEFLKIDFPRLPLTSDKELFRDLAEMGAELVSLHLMESPVLNTLITKYPVAGSNEVEKPHYDEKDRRVYINKTQYFEGVPPEVWEFHIGGYQVCEKWLKDRKGRKLSYDELTHYQKVVVSLKETIRLMDEIDNLIPGWPME